MEDKKLLSASSQLPSTQNNPYAKVAYFGVGYSATFHEEAIFREKVENKTLKISF